MSFYNWAINNGYKEGLSIDRINNNGNYEPNNCRWTTMKVQCNNRRRSIKLEYKGNKYSISDATKIFGIPRATLFSRFKAGYKEEMLFSKEKLPSGRNSIFFSEKQGEYKHVL